MRDLSVKVVEHGLKAGLLRGNHLPKRPRLARGGSSGPRRWARKERGKEKGEFLPSLREKVKGTFRKGVGAISEKAEKKRINSRGGMKGLQRNR